MTRRAGGSLAAMPDAAAPAANPSLTAIVLAAGQGTRMKSDAPKVLHACAGKPMVHHVVDAAFAAGAEDVIVVLGFGREAVGASLAAAYGDRVRTAVQERQLGTGDAVRSALPALRPGAELALILCGDTPLIEAGDLIALKNALAADANLALLTFEAPDPTGYGRILRDAQGRVVGIREHKDCTPEQRRIREVNPAVYVARTPFLRAALQDLKPNNAQGELYFTDVVLAAAPHVGSVTARVPATLEGVNDRAQLAALEDALYRRIADDLRREGVTIRASARVDAGVKVGRDAVIEHHVVLRGRTTIGAGAVVDVGSVLTDVTVADRAVLKPYTVASQSSIGEGAQIGPFSHLRPESRIDEQAHVGNFVETKKTWVKKGAKANHLAYLGDGIVGERVNVGAGTIFCNYDGFAKHTTTIEEDAFIGSDSQLVAPVTIGRGAYVATGTTVTRDVPQDALAISRVKQENKEGYASKLRARMKAAKDAKK